MKRDHKVIPHSPHQKEGLHLKTFFYGLHFGLSNALDKMKDRKKSV
jgi:hypothetical protein